MTMTAANEASSSTASHSAACGCRIAPQSGRGLRTQQGDILRVADPQGEQVSDLFAFSRSDIRCALFSGRSIDYAGKIYRSKGEPLWSNDSKPMFTIVADDVGRHDFLLTPCSQKMLEILYRHQGHHPSCFENLKNAFEAFGIGPERNGYPPPSTSSCGRRRARRRHRGASAALPGR
jgi:uncharacterized protein YcgI (DUF1989 family)